MNAVDTIKAEHRNLSAVLFCLKSLAEEAARRRSEPDFKVFHACVSYIESYLEQFHHPKEERYLFAALRRRSAASAALLDALQDEHRRGAELLLQVRRALSEYEYRSDAAVDDFLAAVKQYAELEYRHAQREEAELLPLARDHLSDDDWKTADAAFSNNDDPLFGERPRERYRQLLGTIVRLAPAPHGVGPGWPSRPDRP